MAQIGSTRALFGFVNGHGVLLERLLEVPEPPTIGYAMSWDAYAAITPEADKYYAVYDGATTAAINSTVTLTYEEYQQITPVETTLYYINDPDQGLIYDVRYGTVEVDVVYYGSTEWWRWYDFVSSKELTDTTDGVTYQTIWDACKNNGGFITDYYYIYVNGTYNNKPRFAVYKLSAGDQIKFTSLSSGLYKSSKQYNCQLCDVYWNSRLSIWEAGSSTATQYIYIPSSGIYSPDICTAIRLYVSSLDLKIRAHS